MNMNMKMPDFNVKKLVKEAGSTLSRVVQVYIIIHNTPICISNAVEVLLLILTNILRFD